MDIISYNKRIALFNDAYYRVAVELDGFSCTMTFVWNERTKRFHASLFKQDGTEVFTGVKVNSLSFFPLNSNLKANGFLGLFVLTPFDPLLVESDDVYRSWADYFTLVYRTDLDTSLIR